MIYRKAVPADIRSIMGIGIEALKRCQYTDLVIDPEKIEQLARQCVSAARNFAWVAEQDGVVVASVCAIVHPCMVYARNQASVVLCATRARGAVLPLLREFMRWARARPGIKIISFTLERNTDPRIGKLLCRLGLKMALPVYLETL